MLTAKAAAENPTNTVVQGPVLYGGKSSGPGSPIVEMAAAKRRTGQARTAATAPTMNPGRSMPRQ
jgi:hypothetical protein